MTSTLFEPPVRSSFWTAEAGLRHSEGFRSSRLEGRSGTLRRSLLDEAEDVKDYWCTTRPGADACRLERLRGWTSRARAHSARTRTVTTTAVERVRAFQAASLPRARPQLRSGGLRLGRLRSSRSSGRRDATASLVEKLSAHGLDFAVITGTHVGNVDDQLGARPHGPGRLLFCVNRGSEVYEADADDLRLVARRERPTKRTLLSTRRLPPPSQTFGAASTPRSSRNG